MRALRIPALAGMTAQIHYLSPRLGIAGQTATGVSCRPYVVARLASL